MSKSPLAVFTIAQFEPLFFPVWLKHYTAHVEADDIWVLHHPLPVCAASETRFDFKKGRSYPDWVQQLTEAQELGVQVLPVHNADSFSHEWLRDTVQTFHRFLLQSYEQVLFVEVDEVVAPTTSASLADWVAARVHRVRAPHYPPIYRTTGYEVVHRDDEPPLDWTKPLLRQRQWCYESRLYSKPCLSSVPLDWEIGFHDAPQAAPYRTCHDLTLVHLHKIDFPAALARSREIASRRLSQKDVAQGWGFQSYETDPEKLRWYFSKNMDTVRRPFDPNAEDVTLVPVPEHLRDLV